MTDANSADAESDQPRPARPVHLSDVLREMEMAIDEWSSYVNRETGDVIGLLDDAFLGAEELDDDEEPTKDSGDADPEMIALARDIDSSDKYERLPGQFEIHEWSVMRDYSESVASDVHRSELLDAIHGGGAFRSFKSTIDRLELRDAWFRYRDDAIEQVAIDWLEAHDIPWVRTRSDNADTHE